MILLLNAALTCNHEKKASPGWEKATNSKSAARTSQPIAHCIQNNAVIKLPIRNPEKNQLFSVSYRAAEQETLRKHIRSKNMLQSQPDRALRYFKFREFQNLPFAVFSWVDFFF